MKLKRKNKYRISYYWRGDIEDEECWAFPTKEDAWAFVLGKIRKRIKAFEPDENTDGHGKTIIDFDAFKKSLLESGEARCEYCQCGAWWDNWFYWEGEEEYRPMLGF